MHPRTKQILTNTLVCLTRHDLVPRLLDAIDEVDHLEAELSQVNAKLQAVNKSNDALFTTNDKLGTKLANKTKELRELKEDPDNA